MRRLTTRTWFVLLAVSLWPMTASAEATSARVHYQQGTTYYDLGQFLDAAKEYEAAYRLRSDPVLLFNIGQAYRLAGENEKALHAYRSYLRRVPDARNRREVKARIAMLDRLVREQARAKTSPPMNPLPPTQVESKDEPVAAAEMATNDPAPAAATAASTVPVEKSTETIAPQPIAAAQPEPAARATQPAAAEPVYKKWWLWTIVGVVVAAGVGASLGIAYTTPNDAPASPGTHDVRW